MKKASVETKATTSLIENGERSYLKPTSAEGRYAALRAQPSAQETNQNLTENTADSKNTTRMGPPSGVAMTWESMKNGFQKFKSNIEAKKFLPLRQVQQDAKHSRGSSSESLDEIFERLKRPMDHRNFDEDEDDEDIKPGTGTSR